MGKNIIKRKILPLQINAELKIECWTYYKMAIIQTLPRYMNWLSAHMNIFYGYIGENLYFGNGPIPHEPEYFSDILCIEEIDLFDISSDDIVRRIKSELDNDYYFVVFLRSNDYIHEAFIYGYDDNEQSFMSIAFETGKGFHTVSLSYHDVKIQYKSNYEYYMNNCDQYYWKRNFGYVMSRIKPVYKYLKKNYAFEYFEKIYHEVYGKRIDLNDNSEIDEYLTPHIYYTGVSCLNVIRNELLQLHKMLANKEKSSLYQHQLRKKFFKLLEHRKLLVLSMRWYEQIWSITDDELCNIVIQYENCCVDMEKICFLFIKFEQTLDDSVLEHIKQMIEAQYEKEKQILGQYAILIRAWYCNVVLKKLLKSNCEPFI